MRNCRSLPTPSCSRLQTTAPTSWSKWSTPWRSPPDPALGSAGWQPVQWLQGPRGTTVPNRRPEASWHQTSTADSTLPWSVLQVWFQHHFYTCPLTLPFCCGRCHHTSLMSRVVKCLSLHEGLTYSHQQQRTVGVGGSVLAEGHGGETSYLLSLTPELNLESAWSSAYWESASQWTRELSVPISQQVLSPKGVKRSQKERTGTKRNPSLLFTTSLVHPSHVWCSVQGLWAGPPTFGGTSPQDPGLPQPCRTCPRPSQPGNKGHSEWLSPGPSCVRPLA